MNHNESRSFNFKYDITRKRDDDEVLKKVYKHITPPSI